MKFTYRTGDKFGLRIDRLEVIKETKGTITVVEHLPLSGRVERKYVKSSSTHFDDTWEAARKSLMESAQFDLQHARRRLELVQARVGNIKGMKEKPE